MAIILALCALVAALTIALMRCPLMRMLTLAIDSWADETQGQLKQPR